MPSFESDEAFAARLIDREGSCSVTVGDEGGGAVVHVAGDLDVWTAPLVWRALQSALRKSSSVVVDLRDVTSIDPTGLSVLVRAKDSVGGGELVVGPVPTSSAESVRRAVAFLQDANVVIGRAGDNVGITCRGRLDPGYLEQIRQILFDLVEDHDNLSVDVQLPDVDTVDPNLVDLVVEVGDRLASHAGYLSVTTGDGQWTGDGSRVAVQPGGKLIRKA
jgi:anti-anti-sigma factor